ncbi:Crp/Fnr family transcriptional regulator [Aureispira anguillae]|uniref:Crp/Fnr family transcriptional regulator n=1 Tax=Aureispira anguillae TaxID=2864201 RepID=A0A915YC58_9BACT|nr:Crp/Fnr family transcriptional regulator [Aureispira anguillae]BDS10388.1 Crp/Fnr family transcriptional regulator [Aureispira anguillae]
MTSIIVDYISNFVDLDEREISAIKEGIPIKNFKKGTILLREGQVSKMAFFNLKGCVRSYGLFNGEEKTTFFYLENRFITSMRSFTQQVPAAHYLECIEDCTLGLLSYDTEKRLLQTFPKFEFLSRLLLEEELGNYQEMLSSYIMTNPERRYLNLIQNHPELKERIPQYHLATYLGITPESLSRIRKRLSTK